jgi:flagellar hook-length control protein FliK
MATIAKVLTQDGRAPVGPAGDAAGGEPGVEFLALLTEATGVLPAPAAVAVPPGEAMPADDGSSAPGDAGGALAGGLAALAANGDPRLASPGGIEVARAAARSAGLRADLATELPAVPADVEMLPDTGAQSAPGDLRTPPAAMLPTTASPVAAAVLHALQSGQRSAPHVASRPLAGQPVADPAPVTEVVGQLADAVAEIVASSAGEQGEPDGDSSQHSSAAPGMPGGVVARDAAAGAAHLRTVPGTVGTPAWRHALGTEVRLMIERGIGAATLRLSPEHLGPVEVRIDFADDSANVWFAASHADTRAALADALPRLRDMLASVGVNLGESGVHRDLPGEAERRDGAWRATGSSMADAGAESRVVVTRLDAGRGMLDEYA